MCQTQWSVGVNGATGLRYEALFAILDRNGLDTEDWWRMFDDIRLMERTALETMREE